MPSLSERKRLHALLRRKGRSEQGRALVEGPRALAELAGAGLRIEIVVHTAAFAGEPDGASLLQSLAGAGARIEEVDDREMAGFADTSTPQGVIAAVEIPARNWDDLASRRILLLDGVQDPGNVGTLVRTAEALGAGGVVALPGTADPWGPKAVRAAAASVFRLPVLTADPDEAIAACEARGIPLWIADASGEPVRRADPMPPAVALALGNEGVGVSGRLRAAGRRVVAVRLADATESLNVAVAGAILMDRIFGGLDAPD